MDKSRQRRLSRENAFGREFVNDNIKARVRSSITFPEENAIDRKAIKHIYDILIAMGADVASDVYTEFMAYNNAVETIKAEEKRYVTEDIK